MVIKFEPNEKGNPPGKLADAALYFLSGPLAGLQLQGFAVWQSKFGGSRINVTLPARQYAVNGERRSFALLRPQPSTTADQGEALRRLIVDAWQLYTAHPDDGAVLPLVAPPACFRPIVPPAPVTTPAYTDAKNGKPIAITDMIDAIAQKRQETRAIPPRSQRPAIAGW